MINKNSLVSVGFGKEEKTTIGKLVEYSFYTPTGNGQITVVIEPITSSLDKTIASKLVGEIGEIINIFIHHGDDAEPQAVFLTNVTASSLSVDGSYEFDRLSITGNKP